MFLILIKFHELYWYFYLKVRIWDKNEVIEPHQAGAAEPACAVGPADEVGPVGAVGSAGVAGPAPYHDPSSGDYHFHKHTLYE
jgi:hypothetical protein